METAPQQVAPAPEPTKAMSTLDRITTLSDLANAVRDEEIVRVIKAKANGERLYELFVKSVSDEIETLMNPNAAAAAQVPKVMNGVQEISSQIFEMSRRIGGVLQAIEQGAGLAVLQMLIHKLGGQAPAPQQQPVYHQPQQQAPQPAHTGITEGREIPQVPGAGGRGGMLGTW